MANRNVTVPSNSAARMQPAGTQEQHPAQRSAAPSQLCIVLQEALLAMGANQCSRWDGMRRPRAESPNTRSLKARELAICTQRLPGDRRISKCW